MLPFSLRACAPSFHPHFLSARRKGARVFLRKCDPGGQVVDVASKDAEGSAKVAVRTQVLDAVTPIVLNESRDAFF